ncbi:MAG: type II toxin-antitoxin system VapC family toxin [Bryobacteraceae bacterium]|nr:type II toxin-antitoxin system VapC family toxin [Bryobacteraceae bacterium]
MDTHILIWWLTDAPQLSKDQLRVLENIQSRCGTMYISAISLLEIAVAYGAGNRKFPPLAEEMIRRLDQDPAFVVLPIDAAVGSEVAAIGPSLVDPMDRAIVATARVHRMTLITADERIIDSKLVRVLS